LDFNLRERAHTVNAEEFLARFAGDVDTSFEQVRARYGVGREEYAIAVGAIVVKYAVAKASEPRSDAEIRKFVLDLRADELCLAVACARGDEGAWSDFVRDHKGFVEQCARQLAYRYRWPEAAADDLVDALWGDLYGLRGGGEGRASKFAAYAGIGSLRGWLRAVLYQMAVNHYRRQRDTVPIEDVEHVVTERRAQSGPLAERYVVAARQAVSRALGELDSEQKLVLAYYYFDEMTLKQIGQLYGVHEATASRWVSRAQADVRKAVERILRKDFAFNAAQIEACLASAARGEGLDVRGLVGGSRGPSAGDGG
jgi:RNA polymerase sigma-70 factor, ECF subfamily